MKNFFFHPPVIFERPFTSWWWAGWEESVQPGLLLLVPFLLLLVKPLVMIGVGSWSSTRTAPVVRSPVSSRNFMARIGGCPPPFDKRNTTNTTNMQKSQNTYTTGGTRYPFDNKFENLPYQYKSVRPFWLQRLSDKSIVLATRCPFHIVLIKDYPFSW